MNFVRPATNLHRNDKWFITALPDKWRVDYERRKEQYKTGYFSSTSSPFKPFANFKSAEVIDILEDAFTINLSKHPTVHFQVGCFAFFVCFFT